MRPFFHWLAGFIDGEGHFGIRQSNPGNWSPHFVMELRDDDRPIIEQIQRETGIGFLKARERSNASRPQVAWEVVATRDLLWLVNILDRYPLRAKKARDYAIWRAAVEEYVSPVRSWDRMFALKEALQAIRKYDDPVELTVIESPQLRLVV